MNKISMFLLLGSLSTLSLANGNFDLRVGGDIHSKVNSLGVYSSGNTEDYGYEIGIEYTKPLTEKLELGLGVAYQNHAKISGEKSGFSKWNGVIESEYSKGYEDFKGYDSIPIYLIGEYTLTNKWIFRPYIKVNLGYTFNFGSEDIKYKDGVEYENESIDTDLGGQIFDSYNLSTDIKNGLYYAAGIGIEYKRLALEMLYQVNEAKLYINNKKYDSNYNRISLVLNYKF